MVGCEACCDVLGLCQLRRVSPVIAGQYPSMTESPKIQNPKVRTVDGARGEQAAPSTPPRESAIADRNPSTKVQTSDGQQPWNGSQVTLDTRMTIIRCKIKIELTARHHVQ
eukprot:1378910-Amorphochlora_amoeboformis.AAC.2